MIKEKLGGICARECPAYVSVSDKKMPDDRARGTVGPGGGGGRGRLFRLRGKPYQVNASVRSVPRGWEHAGRATPLASVCKIYERTRPCPGQPTE